MRIQQLHLYSKSLPTQRKFYMDVLEFPLLEDSSQRLVFQAGTSQLILQQSQQHLPYHVAFNVHPDGLAQAKSGLEQKLGLIPDSTNQTEFFSEDWNAHMVYFRDAEGNILELIAHHTLSDDFYPRQGHPVKSISEIGWATVNVPGTVTYLEQTLGFKPYKNTSSTFTAIGDEHGLIIVVQQGRIWFPETGVAAGIAPFVLMGTGEKEFKLEYPLQG